MTLLHQAAVWLGCVLAVGAALVIDGPGAIVLAGLLLVYLGTRRD